MENISKNISYRQATHSQMAISIGYNNTPDPQQLATMKHTAEKIFEPIKHAIPAAIISSFFRTPQVNVLIGGSKTSQHCKGEAIDIDSHDNTTNAQIFNYIKNNLEFDQLIWEFGNNNNPDWVHVSLKKNGNRKQILKSTKIGKQTTYKQWS